VRRVYSKRERRVVVEFERGGERRGGGKKA